MAEWEVPEEEALDPQEILEFDDVLEMDGRELRIRDKVWDKITFQDYTDPREWAQKLDEAPGEFDIWRIRAGLARRDLDIQELYFERWMAQAGALARQALKEETTSKAAPTDRAVRDSIIKLNDKRYMEWQTEIIRLRERLNRYESTARACEKRCATLPSVVKLLVQILETEGGLRVMGQPNGKGRILWGTLD